MWLEKLADPATTFEELSDPEQYEKLDDALLAAILVIASGNIGRDIYNKIESISLKKDGSGLTGAQAFWMICRSHDIEEGSGFLFNIVDLTAIVFSGSDVPGFLRNWVSDRFFINL